MIKLLIKKSMLARVFKIDDKIDNWLTKSIKDSTENRVYR